MVVVSRVLSFFVFVSPLSCVAQSIASLLLSSVSSLLRLALMEPSGSAAAAAAASSAPTKRSTVAAVNGGSGGRSRGGALEPGSIGAASTASSTKRHRKPKPSLFQRFAQQELSGWSPIITPRGLVAYFLIAGVLCAAAGGALLAATLSVVEASARYDDVGPFSVVDATASATNAARQALLAAADGNGVNVTVDIPITKAMRPPVRRCFV